jgi:exopolysaccharide biosynthesis protein
MRLRVGLLLVVLLAASLVVTFLPRGTPERSPDRGSLTGSGEPSDSHDSGQPPQTSDGLPGEIADVVPMYLRGKPKVRHVRKWWIAPGVRFRRWDRIDARGQIRAYLLRVDPSVKGVRIDYASRAKVPERAPLTRLLKRDRAVAGVNGGFFDIYDTGAPLGVGQDRQRGFLHAARHTWNNAFWTSGKGESGIGKVLLEASIAEYPQMQLTNVNSPRARAGAIGVWNRKWGDTSGYSITDGQRSDVRMVVIDGGLVVANTADLTRGKEIDGIVLVGRGPGADQLAQMRVGSTATVRWRLATNPAFAISGERVLLRGRKIVVTDDRILHPRTAVGVDRDSGEILLLAIDGRQTHSRGYTLVELARMMKRLGADTALNLDGGGSTTMVGRDRRGRVRVLNKPSDGSQRAIPEGIAVIYRKPR